MSVATCLNAKCRAELPQYRIDRQNVNITKWWFCQTCHKYGRGKEPFEWKCFREDCDNIIRDVHSRRRPYCSTICKRRKQMKTEIRTEKRCEICGDVFFPRSRQRQRYCTVQCGRQYTYHRRMRERKTHIIENAV